MAEGKAVENILDIIEDWRYASEDLVLKYLYTNDDVDQARSDFRAIVNLHNKLLSIIQSGKIAEKKLNEMKGQK